MQKGVEIDGRNGMASRWRRRRMCLLIANGPAPAALTSISAIAASLETNARPAIGSRVRLQHPEAGVIEGEVTALSANGVTLGFVLGDAAWPSPLPQQRRT